MQQPRFLYTNAPTEYDYGYGIEVECEFPGLRCLRFDGANIERVGAQIGRNLSGLYLATEDREAAGYHCVWSLEEDANYSSRTMAVSRPVEPVTVTIAYRDHEGTLKCLLCGRVTGHDALLLKAQSVCGCWPHEVAALVQSQAAVDTPPVRL